MQNKSSNLDAILRDLDSFAVAFSGGVDSSFLVHRSGRLKNGSVIAVTIRTPYIPAREISEAVRFAGMHGIRHEIIDVPFPETIKNNPDDRCYLCKKKLFSEILDFAAKNNLKHVVDGSNADDSNYYRPGIRALAEMSIRSPLAEAGLTKEDIRVLSKSEGLNIWDKPAMACLLTRIPYNTLITDDMISMIETAETVLFDKGYPGVRVRIHGDLARIECLPGYMEKMIHDPERDHIINDLKKLGFRYVSLDLEGYRTGSFNPGG